MPREFPTREYGNPIEISLHSYKTGSTSAGLSENVEIDVDLRGISDNQAMDLIKDSLRRKIASYLRSLRIEEIQQINKAGSLKFGVPEIFGSSKDSTENLISRLALWQILKAKGLGKERIVQTYKVMGLDVNEIPKEI